MNKKIFIIFAIIIFIGSVLRVYRLDYQSLWNDELESWRKNRVDNLSLVIKESEKDVNPPGYQILLFYEEKLLGDSEFSLRFLSALAGTLSIFIIFLLGKRLYSANVGLMAALLMAVLDSPIYYSQEARPYGLMILFCLLTTYFLLNITDKINRNLRPEIRSVILYIISAVVLAYLHYFGLYLVVLQGLVAVLFYGYKKKGWWLVIIYLMIAVMYLPWLPAMSQDMGSTASWITKPDIKSFYGFIRFLFNESRFTAKLFLIFWGGLLAKALYDRFLSKKSIKGERNSENDILLSLWLAVPFIGVYVKSIISSPILTYRNLIILLPAGYLIAARILCGVVKSKAIQIIIGIIILIISIQHLFSFYYKAPHKTQFRESSYYIVDNYSKQKPSVIIGFAWWKDYFDYYFMQKKSPIRIDYLLGEKKDIPVLQKIIEKNTNKYVWLIFSHRTPDKEFLDYLDKNLKLIDHQKYIEAEVKLFRIKDE